MDIERQKIPRIQRVAVEIPGEGASTYGDLEARVARAAGWLSSAGVRGGDVVAIALPRSLYALEILLGAIRLSACVLPLNDRYTPRELSHPLRHAQTALAILPDERCEDLADLGVPLVRASEIPMLLESAPLGDRSIPYDLEGDLEARRGSALLLLYTSGTTGLPKGVPMRGSNLLATIRALREAWELSESDVLLHVLPQYHVHGLVVATFGMLAAGGLSRWQRAQTFEPASVLAELASGEITTFMAVPTLWHRLAEQEGRFDLSGLRLATSGSAGLPSALHRRVRERFGVEIVERYGMTEAGIVTSNPLRGERRPGSIGKPLQGAEIAIIGADGHPCAPGEVGELFIRGPSVFSGYHRDPAATREAFSGDWLKSGDLGSRGEDGYITLAGRRSELVITGGFNVYPAEIEAVLLSCPGVREAAVVGIKDDDLGEVPVAVIVGRPDPGTLEAKMRRELAPYKIPRIVRAVDSLPRNAMGKIVKSIVWSSSEGGVSIRE